MIEHCCCCLIGFMDRLLPLVRFPQMAAIVPLMAEPLFIGHPLAAQLSLECHASFATSAAVVDCRRGVPGPLRLQRLAAGRWNPGC